jgi:Zn-finger nucleic acid-binding protein
VCRLELRPKIVVVEASSTKYDRGPGDVAHRDPLIGDRKGDFMDCPLDGTQLVMSERQGIEIDYCPKCRGVWLDRGELDKLIERAGDFGESSRPSHGGPSTDKRKKKNLLSELFEFGG